MKKIIIVVMIMILVSGCNSNNNEVDNTTNSINSITTKEVNTIVKEEKDYIIIDVRTKEEYESGHIKGAINIPVDDINSIDIDKNKRIIVYCKSGKRSNNAANILLNKGYKYIYDMGGINNWQCELVGE